MRVWCLNHWGVMQKFNISTRHRKIEIAPLGVCLESVVVVRIEFRS